MNIKKIWFDSDVLDITDIDTIKEQLNNYYTKSQVDGFVLALENSINGKASLDEVNQILLDYVTKEDLEDYPVLTYEEKTMTVTTWDGKQFTAKYAGKDWEQVNG